MAWRLLEWGRTGQQCRRTKVNKLRRYVASRRRNLERNSGLDAVHSVKRPPTQHRVHQAALVQPRLAPTEWEFIVECDVERLGNVFNRQRPIAGALERRKVCGT